MGFMTEGIEVDGVQVTLFRGVHSSLLEITVASVDEGFGVVAVALDGGVGVVFGLGGVALEVGEDGEVVGGGGQHAWVLFFEFFKDFDGLVMENG